MRYTSFFIVIVIVTFTFDRL